MSRSTRSKEPPSTPRRARPAPSPGSARSPRTATATASPAAACSARRRRRWRRRASSRGRAAWRYWSACPASSPAARRRTARQPRSYAAGTPRSTCCCRRSPTPASRSPRAGSKEKSYGRTVSSVEGESGDDEVRNRLGNVLGSDTRVGIVVGGISHCCGAHAGRASSVRSLVVEPGFQHRLLPWERTTSLRSHVHTIPREAKQPQQRAHRHLGTRRPKRLLRSARTPVTRDAVEFRLLGPLEAVAARESLPLGGPGSVRCSPSC